MRWNDEYLLRIIAEEGVLVPVAGEAAKSCEIAALNETAVEICRLVRQDKREEEIVDALCEIYDADRAELERDVSQTLRMLESIGAVKNG